MESTTIILYELLCKISPEIISWALKTEKQ